jgi:hypothetical protein
VAAGELGGVAVLVAGAGVRVADEVLMLASRLEVLAGAAGARFTGCGAWLQPAHSAASISRGARQVRPVIR